MNDKLLQKLTDAYSWNETVLFLNGRVRELKQENGGLKAFIDEQAETIKRLESEIKKQEKLKGDKYANAIKREHLYQELKTKLDIATETIRKSREDRDRLISELHSKK